MDRGELRRRAPRDHCRKLWEALDGMPRAEIAAMQERAEHSFLHEGITFAVYGEEGAQERIIPIDVLPRLLDAGAWELIERGLRQRLEALNRFLADIYGPFTTRPSTSTCSSPARCKNLDKIEAIDQRRAR